LNKGQTSQFKEQTMNINELELIITLYQENLWSFKTNSQEVITMNILNHLRHFTALSDHFVFCDSHAEVNPISDFREISPDEVNCVSGGRDELAAAGWERPNRLVRKRKRCQRRSIYVITPR
jgi:hypothetical protein